MNEAVLHCEYCGEELTGKQTRFCSRVHKERYTKRAREGKETLYKRTRAETVKLAVAKREARGPQGPGLEIVDARLLLAEATRLRVKGVDWPTIAKNCGYANGTAARQAVNRACIYWARESAEEYRAWQLKRLDDSMQIAYEIAHRQGDDTKDSVRLQAIDTIVRIEDRRSRLLGMDKPKTVDVFKLAVAQAKAMGCTDEEANLAGLYALKMLEDAQQPEIGDTVIEGDYEVADC